MLLRETHDLYIYIYNRMLSYDRVKDNICDNIRTY